MNNNVGGDYDRLTDWESTLVSTSLNFQLMTGNKVGNMTCKNKKGNKQLKK
jgi:hypothetical protein